MAEKKKPDMDQNSKKTRNSTEANKGDINVKTQTNGW